VWGKYTPKIASLRAQACRRLYQKGYITYRVGECRPGISEPFLSYKGKCGVVLTEKGEEKGRELANEIDNYLGEWGKYSSVVAEEIRKLNSQREEYQRKFNKLS